MPDVTFAAYLFSALMSIVMAFQLLLALGVPWGEWAIGGRFPGRLPPFMRWVALLQFVLLALMTAIVLDRAGIIDFHYLVFSRNAVWAVASFSLVATILNVITPNKKERTLWAPVSLVMFLCSIFIAVST
jgi:hypothetical protein